MQRLILLVLLISKKYMSSHKLGETFMEQFGEFTRLSELFRFALVVTGAGGQQIEALYPGIFEITAIFAYLCLRDDQFF